jgi:hypothetical protein
MLYPAVCPPFYPTKLVILATFYQQLSPIVGNPKKALVYRISLSIHIANNQKRCFAPSYAQPFFIKKRY